MITGAEGERQKQARMVGSSINEREGCRRTGTNSIRKDNKSSGLLICASKQRPLEKDEGTIVWKWL